MNLGEQLKHHQPVELRNLGITLGGKEILADCTAKINWQDRIGLVGPNGSGKTTLLNIITEKIEPVEGRLINKDAQIGYLPQDMTLEGQRTVWEVATDDVSVDSYDDYRVLAHIERVLTGVGLAQMRETRVENLSGGEKMRLSLARILIAGPNFLILDEPTNHLDLKVCLWLEEFLQGYNGTLLLVSHDRDLLDKVVETI